MRLKWQNVELNTKFSWNYREIKRNYNKKNRCVKCVAREMKSPLPNKNSWEDKLLNMNINLKLPLSNRDFKKNCKQQRTLLSKIKASLRLYSVKLKKIEEKHRSKISSLGSICSLTPWAVLLWILNYLQGQLTCFSLVLVLSISLECLWQLQLVWFWPDLVNLNL